VKYSLQNKIDISKLELRFNKYLTNDVVPLYMVNTSTMQYKLPSQYTIPDNAYYTARQCTMYNLIPQRK